LIQAMMAALAVARRNMISFLKNYGVGGIQEKVRVYKGRNIMVTNSIVNLFSVIKTIFTSRNVFFKYKPLQPFEYHGYF